MKTMKLTKATKATKATKQLWVVVTLLLTVAVSAAIVSAGSTGIITGHVVDKETGDPIVGATVILAGTNRGAATDPDGKYLIPRVEPGEYTLRFAHIDYATLEVTDVKVIADSATLMDASMSRKSAELHSSITVRGKQDILDKFVTDSRVVVQTERIRNKPVTTVDELLEQVAGVETTTEGDVYIHSTRAGEVSYIVDGLPITVPPRCSS